MCCRELEARLGSTPPPSPSDCNSPALLTSRIAQLSAEVDKLRRMLQQTEAQSGFKVYYDVIMMSLQHSVDVSQVYANVYKIYTAFVVLNLCVCVITNDDVIQIGRRCSRSQRKREL